jgi:hypothetical protein
MSPSAQTRTADARSWSVSLPGAAWSGLLRRSVRVGVDYTVDAAIAKLSV